VVVADELPRGLPLRLSALSARHDGLNGTSGSVSPHSPAYISGSAGTTPTVPP
jgi:hypothetical protein